MLTDEKKKEASESLQGLVKLFNQELMEWMTKTGCRANFGWMYGKNNESIKQLEILGIDLEIYRKPAPDFMTMQEGLKLDRGPVGPPLGEAFCHTNLVIGERNV